MSSGQVMDAATSSFNLGTVLLASIVLFPLACLFFGTRGGYYNTCLLYTSDAADDP